MEETVTLSRGWLLLTGPACALGIGLRPGTVAFFPQDWKGTCRVHETVRKVYMIR